MYCDILTTMFNQYIDCNAIDQQLWEQLGQSWASNPCPTSSITLQTGPNHRIRVNPWSLAVASNNLETPVCTALLKDPEAHHNMFHCMVGKPPISFFDFVIKSANYGKPKEKVAACAALDQIHHMHALPHNTVVLTASPSHLPEKLAQWAIAHDMGVMEYYTVNKAQPHTSIAWETIQAFAQKNTLTDELALHGQPAIRKLKL